MNEYTSIKNWSEDDRPREKLLNKGKQNLSDAELITILIGSGTKKFSALELSKQILKSVNYNLNELGKLNVADLMKHKGIGEAKAVTIIAALELGRRHKVADILERKKITCSKDVFEIFNSILAELPFEEFWIILLNRANKIIDKIKISQGGISGTVADVRLIMKYAIDKLATGIILCHNHPSGNLKPSREDINLTDKIKKAGDIMDITLLDHIIIGNNTYKSFTDEGLI